MHLMSRILESHRQLQSPKVNSTFPTLNPTLRRLRSVLKIVDMVAVSQLLLSFK